MHRSLLAELNDRHTQAFRLAFIVLLAACMLLRLRGLGWDGGLMLHPDERNLVTAALQLSFPDHLVPEFHAYNGLSLYLPRLLAELLHAIGVTAGVGPAEVAFAARLLSCLFSIAAVLAIFKIAENVLGSGPALLAGMLAAFSPGLIQAAHFGTSESALVFCVAVTSGISVAHLQRRMTDVRAALCYGVVIGLGLGFKTTAAALVIIPVAVFVLRCQRNTLWRNSKFLILSGLIAASLWVITTPQIYAAPQAYLDTMRFEGGVVRGTIDVFWTYQFHAATPVLFELKQFFWLLDPVSAVLMLPGFILVAVQAVRGRGSYPVLLPLLVFSVAYAALIFGWHAKFSRYLLLLLPFAIVCVASLFVPAFRTGQTVSGGFAVGTIAFAALLVGLMQAAIYLRPDSRILASNYLLANMAKGETLVIEPVDVGPPFSGGEKLALTTAVLPLIEASSAEKLQGIADVLSAGDWMVISSRRHSGVLPGMHDRFPEMCGYYEALWSGQLGYEIRQSFTRRGSGILSKLDPASFAEETQNVFDSPKVFVLQNTAQLAAAELLRRLQTAPCP